MMINCILTSRETLYDATTTIYNQIATLRRGMPIAEAKARTEYDRLKVRRSYQAKIKELDAQYKAVWAAMDATPC